MKKHTIFNRLDKVIYLLSFIMLLGSCKKTEYIQKFDDVFDVSGVETFNLKIEDASTLDEYIGIFEDVTLEVPETIQNVSIDEMIDHYKNSIKLSPNEISLLLKNDNETFLNVINRFGSMPSQVGDLEIDFTELKSSPLNKYLVVQKSEINNFYGVDCYSVVAALQDYMINEVIDPLIKIKELAPADDNNFKSANLVFDLDKEKKNKDNAKLIIYYNNHSFWWIIWWWWHHYHHHGGGGH